MHTIIRFATDVATLSTAESLLARQCLLLFDGISLILMFKSLWSSSADPVIRRLTCEELSMFTHTTPWRGSSPSTILGCTAWSAVPFWDLDESLALLWAVIFLLGLATLRGVWYSVRRTVRGWCVRTLIASHRKVCGSLGLLKSSRVFEHYKYEQNVIEEEEAPSC